MPDNNFFKQRPDLHPTIYVYELPQSAFHKGYIKIGYTGRDVMTRIKEQIGATHQPFNVLFQDSAMRPDGSSFSDKDVHRLLERNGFHKLNADGDNEWFNCTVKDVIAAMNELKTGVRLEGARTATFGMRPEQAAAVARTMDYYASAKKDDPNRPPKFLWNAKMRFGKTFASYQLAKKMGAKRVLVLTFKPAVESAWSEDLLTHVDFAGWQFISNKDAKAQSKTIDDQYREADKSKPIVVFGSFQDMLGTTDAGAIKPKNEFIHTAVWDLVIFDEYHYGAWRDNAKNCLKTPTKTMWTLTRRNTAAKKRATPTTKVSSKSRLNTSCICPAHRSAPSTTANSLKNRFITGRIPTNSDAKRNGRTFQLFRIISQSRKKQIHTQHCRA